MKKNRKKLSKKKYIKKKSIRNKFLKKRAIKRKTIKKRPIKRKTIKKRPIKRKTIKKRAIKKAPSLRTFKLKKKIRFLTKNTKDNKKKQRKISEGSKRVMLKIIRLQDIAEVSMQPANPIEDIFLYNGRRVISVSATGSFAQRVYDYVKNAEEQVNDMRQSLPEEFHIEQIYDESIYVSGKFGELIKSFSLASFFVLSLSFFFLGVRPGIIVTAILPFSVSLVLLGF